MASDNKRKETVESNRELRARIHKFETADIQRISGFLPLISIGPESRHTIGKLVDKYIELKRPIFSRCVKGYYYSNSEIFNRFFILKFLSGRDRNNDGYLSVLFRVKNYHFYYLYYFIFTCTVSIVDKGGEQRYPQSFAYHFDSSPLEHKHQDDFNFGLKKYMPMATLLEEKRDLLPDGHLNFLIHIHKIQCGFKLFFRDNISPGVSRCFKLIKSNVGKTYFLQLDSDLVKELCLVSSYFQNMLRSDMSESSTRYMKVPFDEHGYLREVLNLFAGCDRLNCDSIDFICNLYTTAEKYDIACVIETCRDMLEGFYRHENGARILEHAHDFASTILEFAEIYDDERLKSIVYEFLEEREMEDGDKTFPQKKKILFEPKWSCIVNKKGNFEFTKFFESTDVGIEEEDEHCEFDFYQ